MVNTTLDTETLRSIDRAGMPAPGGLLSRLADEIDRLRQAFGILAPICGICDRSLTVEDVIAAEQPGEDGVWLHQSCWQQTTSYRRSSRTGWIPPGPDAELFVDGSLRATIFLEEQ